jgi:ribosomal protein L7/L12
MMMMTMMMIVFAGVIAILLVFFFITAVSNQTPPENISVLVDWNAIADQELQSYLPQQKINAIKRYRELTGCGLKDAKDAVEYAIAYPEGIKKAKFSSKELDTDGAGVRDLIADGRIDEAIDVYAAFMGVDEYTARDAIRAMQREVDAGIRLGDDGLDDVRDLVEQGKKLEAIKLYHELTGSGLKEAKDAVEDME